MCFIRLLLININISAIFYYDFIGGRCVRFNLWGGTVAASSLVGSLVSSLFSFLVSSLVGFLVSSSFGSLLGSSSGYRYSFTIIVLKLVGLLGSYTLYISPLILSNLHGLVYLPLCLILPLRHISTSKLRGRL